MQILVVTTWFPSAANLGAGSFIARDVRALSADHDVRVLHLAPPDLDDGEREFMVDGVPVRRVPLDVRKPRQLLTAARIAHAESSGVDLVHTMAAPALLPFLFRRPRVPWVHTEHWSGIAGLSTRRGRAAWVRPLIVRALESPDRVVAVSDFLARAVRVFRTKPVDVIGNIVDPITDATDSRGTVRAEGPLKMLGVGSVRPNKGWDIAVSALELLLARGVDAELAWMGAGVDLGKLHERAQTLPIRAPGHVAPEVVRDEMREADVFVLPTISETFSLVTVEALAAGLPVVATGIGAHVGFLTSEAGVVVDRDAGAVADAVLEMRSADRSAVRRRGAHLQERFSERQFRRAYSDIYEKAGSGR